MLKTLSGLVAVSWHGEIDLLVWVVPCDGESQVAFSLPVMQCGVVHIQCLKEVFGMLDADVFHSKIIHTECERDGLPVVSPKTGGDSALVISVFN